MKTIIELLKDKNQCLEKFYRLNEAELENFKAGEFKNLESFYATREGLLEIIKKVDEMIERSNDEVVVADTANMEVKNVVEIELEYKNELVSRILEQDLHILSAIEAAKTTIIKELCQVRATRKAAGVYGKAAAGVNLDEEV